MVEIVVDSLGEITLETSHDSWMKLPANLNMREIAYLDSLQQVFKVKDHYGAWIQYKLAPHQVYFHLDDITLKRNEAPQVRIVKKSRNTSFTVSSIVALLMSLSSYKNKIIPVVRLNADRAADLISDIKDIVRHMTPIDIDGQWFPFDTKNVDMKNALSIKIGDVEIRAFPANALASESIRGIRTVGMAGILDEANFMQYFKNLFTALRDSSTGASEHQILIGTTLKGVTPFSEWLEIQEQVGSEKIKIYDWPIFERNEFSAAYSKYSLDLSFHNNDKLIPLVPWQTRENLWEKYLQDEHTFKEEYMAMQVDADEQFYSTALMLSQLREDLLIPVTEFEDLYKKYSKLLVGIDVASVHDYFVITILGRTFEGKWQQFYLSYNSKVDLAEMEQEARGLIRQLLRQHLPFNVSIDANGIGLQITQNFQREFGDDMIRGIKGGTIKDNDGNSHKLNEYGHTKLKRMLIDRKLELIDNELLLKHFVGWNYEFKCMSTESGHGDITMAILYAMIYDDIGSIGEGRLYTASEGKGNSKDPNVWYMRDFKQRLGRRKAY